MDLISAAKSGQFETVFSLLQNGCSANLRDKDHATSLYWSACQGHTNICEILIQAGSDINARVTWGSTPLHAAADRGHKAVIEVLIESGADVNATNTRGDTALHIAAYRGHSDVIMTLLRAKADVWIRNEKGKTPQQEAMEGGHRAIAENIINYANVESASRQANGRRAITPDECLPRNHPEMNICNAGARRMSEITLPYRAPEVTVEDNLDDPDYENSDRRTSVPGPLPNFRSSCLDVPPPRPPIGRSISFSGKNDSPFRANTPAQGGLQTASRTHSVGSIPSDSQKLLNDVNRTLSSAEYANHLPLVHHDNSLSQPLSDLTDSSAYSSDYSYRTTSLTSSGGNEATESSDYSSVYGNTRKVPELPPRSPIPSRPDRLSITLRDYTEGNDAGLVLLLRKQLVESYKQTEKLTSENETLNFKCSTLLGRLSETEQMCSERRKECDSIKDMLEDKRKELIEKENVIQTLRYQSVINKDFSKTGFRHLATRLTKEMSEDTLAELHEILRSTLLAHAVGREQASETLDAPHREWVPGVDYVIIGRHQQEEPADNLGCGTPKHISFIIKHLKTGRRLVLKMLLRFRSRDDNQGDSLWNSPEEVDILERLADHPNVIKILHSYESSTERFKKFITLPTAQPHNSVELCSRTTFIVTEQMMTLTKFIKSYSDETRPADIPSFLVHCFYQLLSVLCIFDELCITHDNINETTIFINADLHPVLGGFEMASFNNETKNHTQNDGQQQDYVNVENLARGSQLHRLPRNFPRRNNDLFALGKFFDNILLDDGSQPHDDDTWPPASTSTMTSLSPALWQVLNGIITKFQNFSCRDCLHRIGYTLFGPKRGEVKNQFDTRTVLQTQMFKLLAVESPAKSFKVSQTGQMSIADAWRRDRYEMEAHFLCNITPKQLWEMYKMFEKDNLLMD